MTYPPSEYARAHRDFLAYTSDLDINVLRDEGGLYRHIRFGQLGEVSWFDLITWPNRLVITGDLGDYTFAHVGDLLDMFETTSHGYINPGYWATLLRATGHPAREVSETKVIEHVVHDFWKRREPTIGRNRALFQAIRDEILDRVGHGDERELLANFEHYDMTTRTFFTFPDAAGWDLDDWSVHYLRACWAIVWGIRRYRRATTQALATAAVPS